MGTRTSSGVRNRTNFAKVFNTYSDNDRSDGAIVGVLLRMDRHRLYSMLINDGPVAGLEP